MGGEGASIEGDIIGEGDGESSPVVESLRIPDANDKLSVDEFA